MHKLIIVITALIATTPAHAQHKQKISVMANPPKEVFKPNPCGPSDGVAAEGYRGQTTQSSSGAFFYHDCSGHFSNSEGETGTYTTKGAILCIDGNKGGHRFIIVRRSKQCYKKPVTRRNV